MPMLNMQINHVQWTLNITGTLAQPHVIMITSPLRSLWSSPLRDRIREVPLRMVLNNHVRFTMMNTHIT